MHATIYTIKGGRELIGKDDHFGINQGRDFFKTQFYNRERV